MSAPPKSVRVRVGSLATTIGGLAARGVVRISNRAEAEPTGVQAESTRVGGNDWAEPTRVRGCAWASSTPGSSGRRKGEMGEKGGLGEEGGEAGHSATTPRDCLGKEIKVPGGS